MKKILICICFMILFIFYICILNTRNELSDVYNSTVYIESLNDDKSTSGTGFVYKIENNKAYIITCYHVIDGSEDIYIYDINKNKLKASVLNYDELSDIAIITIENKSHFKEAVIASSNKIKLGDEVYTIGVPLNLDYIGTLTKGIISFVDRSLSLTTAYGSKNFETIQVDVRTNFGNSGGPLLNKQGKVIGMMFLKEEKIDGISFAIPIDYVIDIVEKLEK